VTDVTPFFEFALILLVPGPLPILLVAGLSIGKR
jgi:hypothetical protein